jgi:hypothetical protein
MEMSSCDSKGMVDASSRKTSLGAVEAVGAVEQMSERHNERTVPRRGAILIPAATRAVRGVGSSARRLLKRSAFAQALGVCSSARRLLKPSALVPAPPDPNCSTDKPRTGLI